MATYFKIGLILFMRAIQYTLDNISKIIFPIIFYNKRKNMPPIDDPILKESALSLAKKIRTKELKCIDIMNAFIRRIEQVNPIVNMVVDERYEEARKEAIAVDDFLSRNEKDEEQLIRDTPLLGLPFTTKDSIAVKGLSWTAGLTNLKGRKAEKDSRVIEILKNAGAIPIAITNVPELCMWYESYNKLYGRTLNPYDTNRIPGGSSGGEGVMQALAGSAFGVGSDIGGSIRMPCFFNGIFGHKGSSGIISNDGFFPPAFGERETFLSTGPMVRFSSDLLPLVKIMTQGQDVDLKLDNPVDLSKLKVYYMLSAPKGTCTSPVDPEIAESIKQVVKYFKDELGITAKEVEFPDLRRSFEMWSTSLLESSPKPYLTLMATEGPPVNLPWEFLKWPFRHSRFTLVSLFLGLMEEIFYLFPASTDKILTRAQSLKKEVTTLLGEDGILLYPSHPVLAPYHHEAYFKVDNPAYTAIFNILKLPVTQCPLGLSQKGLPLGVQIVSNSLNDHVTLAVASELEKGFGGWVAPN